MPQHENHIIALDLSTLSQLDRGAFGRAVAKQLEVLMADITNRPVNSAGKSEDRKLIIELKLSPVVELNDDTDTYELAKILLEPTVKGSVPPVRGGSTDVQLRRGIPHFNKDFPQNFYQKTLDFDGAEETTNQTNDPAA